MNAVAVYPGRAGGIHLEDLPAPAVEDVPNGRGVLVEVLTHPVDGLENY
jgi:glucose 1-dehydrogenase